MLPVTSNMFPGNMLLVAGNMLLEATIMLELELELEF